MSDSPLAAPHVPPNGNAVLWDMVSNVVYYVLFVWDDVWRVPLAWWCDNGSRNILNSSTEQLSGRLHTSS